MQSLTISEIKRWAKFAISQDVPKPTPWVCHHWWRCSLPSLYKVNEKGCTKASDLLQQDATILIYIVVWHQNLLSDFYDQAKLFGSFPHPKGQSWSSSVWHSVWPEVPSHPLPNHQTLATAHIGGSKQSCPWPAGSAPRFHHHEQSPQEPVWPCCSKLHKSVLPKFVCPPNKSQGHRLTWWAKIDCHCLHKELLSDCLTTWAKKQTQNLSSNQWQCPWQLEQNFSQKLPQTQSASPIFQSPTSGKVWHERLKLDTNNTGKFQAAFFVPQKLGAVFGSLASNSKTCKYCMFAHKHCSLSDIWHVPVFDSLANCLTCKHCMFAHKHCSLSDIWHVPVFDSLANCLTCKHCMFAHKRYTALSLLLCVYSWDAGIQGLCGSTSLAQSYTPSCQNCEQCGSRSLAFGKLVQVFGKVFP